MQNKDKDAIIELLQVILKESPDLPIVKLSVVSPPLNNDILTSLYDDLIIIKLESLVLANDIRSFVLVLSLFA